MPLRRVVLILTGCLALVACGDDDSVKPHGFTVESSESKPVGDELVIPFAFEDGERWEAEVVLHAKQQSARGEKGGTMPSPQKASARSTIAVSQTYHAGESPHAKTELRYTRVESSQGDVEPPDGITTGSFSYEADGRPDPGSLTLRGRNIALADTLYGSMMMCGLAGSGSWLPAGPFRKGQAWPVSKVLTPKMVGTLLQLGRQSGVGIPNPAFKGTVRVDDIKRDGEGGAVHVAIEALVEVRGEMVRGNQRGSIDMGYRVTGTAVLDLRTGMPISIDAKAEQKMDFMGPREVIQQQTQLELTATARRVKAK